MSETYSDNKDIVFDNGMSIDDFLQLDLTDTEKRDIKTKARDNAFNYINSKLVGKTAVPAVHIPALKQIEVDLVIEKLIQDAFTQETMNVSEWGPQYGDRAREALSNLYFSSSNETPIPDIRNVGDGVITVISINEFTAKTELWTLYALNDTQFSVSGSITGSLLNLTVGDVYPPKDSLTYIYDYGLRRVSSPSNDQYPFVIKIDAGSTDFERGDVFYIKVFASSDSVGKISTGRLVRA